jgi:hypothetical protein
MFFPCHFRDPKCLNLDNILGFILNVPSDYKFGFVLLPLRRRHWVTIRQVHGSYYNLDSKLESPQLIGRVSEKQFWHVTYLIDCGMSALNIHLGIYGLPKTSLEIENTGAGICHADHVAPIIHKVGTNFADKRRSVGIVRSRRFPPPLPFLFLFFSFNLFIYPMVCPESIWPYVFLW